MSRTQPVYTKEFKQQAAEIFKTSGKSKSLYYNRKRRYSSLAYLSPVQYEKQGEQRGSDDT